MFTIPRGDWNPPNTLPEGVEYLCGQQEIGENGYHHFQGVVYFRSKVRFNTAKRSFPITAHLEPTRSEAARDYVRKDATQVAGTGFELGSLPLRRNNRTDWDAVWGMARGGTLSPIPANIRVPHYRTLRVIASDYAVPVAVGRKTKVYWGPTGVGKSRRAWFEAGAPERVYPKDPRSKWWCGYRNQPCVVMDEFRGAIDISHLLRWTDRYPLTVETKGSTVVGSWETMWITSNLHPRDWYVDLDPITYQALERRLEIVEMTESWTEPEEEDMIDVNELINKVLDD